MRRDTILASIQKMVAAEGGDRHPAAKYFYLFQEALETATGAGVLDGLAGHQPLTDGEESADAAERNVGPILLASAVMFAGAEIGHGLRDGLGAIAEAIERLADRQDG